MPEWITAKWLWWAGLYLALGVLLPWSMTRSWARRRHKDFKPTPSRLFRRGELGLLSLLLALSVIWDLQRSGFSPPMVAVGSVLLAMSGIMAASVWVETYCREATNSQLDLRRSWVASRNLSLLVFSISIVTEVLLDRLTKVVH
ncbi:MAG TPA: hypothetical protein VJX16_10695 [Terriglobales bacterium]|nr:hypothetical protein [Terriglobales bacterium]